VGGATPAAAETARALRWGRVWSQPNAAATVRCTLASYTERGKSTTMDWAARGDYLAGRRSGMECHD